MNDVEKQADPALEQSAHAEAEAQGSKWRPLPRGLHYTLATAMFLYALYFLYGAGYQPLPGIEHRAIHLAGGFVFVLLLLAPSEKLVNSRRALVVDMLISVATIVSSIYVFNTFETYSDRVGLPATATDIFFGILIFGVMFEVARRMIGLAFPIVAGAFIFFALFGSWLPAPFTHAGFDLPRFMATFFYTLNGPYGQITQISANYILIFIIFAAFLIYTGGGEFLRNLALVALGKVRGGPGKIAVVASGLMGMLMGSSMANTAATGSITIPMMKRSGYRASFAGGVEATASMGAQIMPPIMGGSIFIMMEILGVAYWDIAGSAFLIGFLFFLGMFFMVDFEAAKSNLRGLTDDELPRFWPVVRAGWYHTIPVAVLVYMLAIQQASPQRAAFWGIVTAMLVMVVAQHSLRTPLNMARTMYLGVRDALVVISVVALASLMAGIISITGLGIRLSSILIELSGGNLIILLIISAIASLIMGMGVPILVAYSVLAVLVAPALIEMGINPLAAHMFIFYFGVMASITPPVAPDAFVAGGIAKASPFNVAGHAVRLASVLYLLPFLFVYNQVLLLDGSIGQIAVAALTASVGIYALACALQGMLLRSRRIPWWMRLSLGAAALAMIVPNFYYSLGGLLVIVLAHVFAGWGSRDQKKGVEHA